MKKFLASIVCALTVSLTACAGGSDANSTNDGDSDSVLVAYFSAQGHTKALAEKIANATGGTLFEIEPTEPYCFTAPISSHLKN